MGGGTVADCPVSKSPGVFCVLVVLIRLVKQQITKTTQTHAKLQSCRNAKLNKYSNMKT